MMRKFLSASAAAALLVGAVSPAYAQSYAMSSSQAPLGATATVNFKMPLGFVPPTEKKASYGLTLGYGQRLDSVASDGRIATRATKLADIRFTDSFKLYKAEVASFDLANLDQDKRLNMTDGGDNTWLWVAGAVAVGVALWLILDDGDDCEDDLDDLDDVDDCIDDIDDD